MELPRNKQGWVDKAPKGVKRKLVSPKQDMAPLKNHADTAARKGLASLHLPDVLITEDHREFLVETLLQEIATIQRKTLHEESTVQLWIYQQLQHVTTLLKNLPQQIIPENRKEVLRQVYCKAMADLINIGKGMCRKEFDEVKTSQKRRTLV